VRLSPLYIRSQASPGRDWTLTVVAHPNTHAY